MRAFAALHVMLSLLWFWLSYSGFRSALSDFAKLHDPAFMRQFANPHLYAAHHALWASAELILGAVLLMMGMTGVVLALGLWRLRRWSRWVALAQAGQLLLLGGILLTALMVVQSWSLYDAWSMMVPEVLLALVTVLVWSPRFNWSFSPSNSNRDIQPSFQEQPG
jgi:hypothetical protein